MRVLSLFDGISCGMLALERAGIPVESYDAFEIDKYAVTVSTNNFPEIKHHGNVFNSDFTKFKGYDLLLGGSPCTYWSIAKKDREITSDGMGFQLFMQYVRALRESECRYFLYENNQSIHQNIKDEISKYLGVEPIMINSALVSAQNRKRCYWTNIPNVTQPDDLGIMLADVLESGVSWQDKSYCMTASYDGAVLYNTLERKQRTMVAVPVGAAQRGRYIDDNMTEQHIEVRNDGKLYQAAVNIFGKSYEYTAKYRAFVKEMKAKEKEDKKRDKLLSVSGASSRDSNGSGDAYAADRSTVSDSENTLPCGNGA